jgi:predicted component of type VI protein secretion system
MNDDLKQLVLLGLSGEHCRLLAERCRMRFESMPALYGTLAWMFTALADEDETHGTATSRANTITQALHRPLLSLLNAESESAEITLARLNDVWRAFQGLMDIKPESHSTC